MVKKHKRMLIIAALVLVVVVVARMNTRTAKTPSLISPATFSTSSSVTPIRIGIEYAVEGQDAAAFGAMGLAAIKPLPESINWSKMQPDLSGPIDYSVADRFVIEYQRAGFQEIVLGLRTLSHAEDNGGTYGSDRPVPTPEHTGDYATWIAGIVERYDNDGVDDMPGLLYPVRYYEIEVEFSSYTPEPVEEYLEQLRIAYQAAHESSADVRIAHSAFLVLTAFDSNPSSAQYDDAFAAMRIPDKHHDLADMRVVLDHPELFDLVNFHELGDPMMIERTVQWLRYEMDKRGYTKPIIISDTVPTPFISYGRATSCTGFALGVVIWPAHESDRCRVADYFNRILDNDTETVAWKNKFVAADMVKKSVIAAHQGVELINTSFTADLPILSTKLGFAGAGNGGFGGVISETYNVFTKKYTVTEYRPGFYALWQLAEQLRGVTTITRESTDADVRLYTLETQEGTVWIGWVHPEYLVLPGDAEPNKTVSLPLQSGATVLEMATTDDAPPSQSIVADNGSTVIPLSLTPVYITAR